MDPRRDTALRLLEYHAWATQKTLDSVADLTPENLNRDMQTSHSSLWGTLEHTYFADSLWLMRFQGERPTRMDDAPRGTDIASLRRLWAGVQGNLISFAGGLGASDWDRVLEYRFISGAEARSPIYETLLHVVNHGTYHRGQIVTMLRKQGAEPIATDFIHFVRVTMTY